MGATILEHRGVFFFHLIGYGLVRPDLAVGMGIAAPHHGAAIL